MPTTRQVLDILSLDELLGLVDGHDVFWGSIDDPTLERPPQPPLRKVDVDA